MKRNKQDTKIILQIDEIGFYLECNDSQDLVLLGSIINNKVIEKGFMEGLSYNMYLYLKKV